MASEALLRETVLSERLLLLTLGGDTPLTSYGVNCLAFAGPKGTLLVDPFIAPAHARLAAEALDRRGFPPVTHAVLTHHHTDHALGAAWFAARGAAVVAQRRCGPLMAAQHPQILRERRSSPSLAPLFADAAPHWPSIAFDEALTIDLGGRSVEVRHLGPGHTPCDAVVLFPSEGAVAAGDLLHSGYHFNYEEAAPALPDALDRLGAIPAAVLVPGHGPQGGPELVEVQRRYHAAARRLVEAAPDAEAARRAILDEFPGHRLQVSAGTAWAYWRR